MRRGTTLAEALLVGFMLSVVLSVVGLLVNEYARTSAYSTQKDRFIAGAQTALETVRADLSAAVGSVGVSATNPKLTLQRIDPAQLSRVGPVSTPTFWDPFDSANLTRVEYFLTGEVLFRRVAPPGLSAQDQELASGVQGFQVTPYANGRYQVSITFIEQTRLSSATTSVLRRIGQEPPL